MPHFYFDHTSGGTTLYDDVGLEFDSLEEAYERSRNIRFRDLQQSIDRSTALRSAVQMELQKIQLSLATIREQLARAHRVARKG